MADLHHKNFEAMAFGLECLWPMTGGIDFVHDVAEYMPGGLFVVSRGGADARPFVQRFCLEQYFPEDHIFHKVSGPQPDVYVDVLDEVPLVGPERKKLLVVQDTRLEIEAARKSGALVVSFVSMMDGVGVGIQMPNFEVQNYQDLRQQMGIS